MGEGCVPWTFLNESQGMLVCRDELCSCRRRRLECRVPAKSSVQRPRQLHARSTAHLAKRGRGAPPTSVPLPSSQLGQTLTGFRFHFHLDCGTVPSHQPPLWAWPPTLLYRPTCAQAPAPCDGLCGGRCCLRECPTARVSARRAMQCWARLVAGFDGRSDGRDVVKPGCDGLVALAGPEWPSGRPILAPLGDVPVAVCTYGVVVPLGGT